MTLLDGWVRILMAWWSVVRERPFAMVGKESYGDG